MGIFGPAGGVPGNRGERPASGRPWGAGPSQAYPQGPVPLPPASDRPEGPLAQKEAAAFITDSLQALGEGLLEAAAYAHGVGGLYKVVEFVYRASQWERVAEGDGGVNVQVPIIRLGPGVELDVSVNLADGSGTSGPPLTVCLAPSGESSVGVLAIGRLEIDPAVDHADARSDLRQPAQKRPSSSVGTPPDASSGRAPFKSAVVPPDASSGRAPFKSAVVPPDASSGRAPFKSAVVPPDASSGRAPFKSAVVPPDASRWGFERAGDTAEAYTRRPTERVGRARLVRLGVWSELPPGEPKARVAAVQRLAEKELLPKLRQRWRLLRYAGVDFVVGDYSAMGLVVWVRLDDADQQPWQLLIGPDMAGRLGICQVK